MDDAGKHTGHSRCHPRRHRIAVPAAGAEGAAGAEAARRWCGARSPRDRPRRGQGFRAFLSNHRLRAARGQRAGVTSMTETIIASRVVGGWRYQIDTDAARLDIALIHHFLAKCSHWAWDIPLDTLRRALAHSMAFGIYREGAQVGFARIVTDQATFAYLA